MTKTIFKNFTVLPLYFYLPYDIYKKVDLKTYELMHNFWDRLTSSKNFIYILNSILCASITIGYIQATLEPHMRQFITNPLIMGLMFVINGATYAVFAPVFGLICDLWLPPIVLTTMGSVLITLSFVSLLRCLGHP